MQALNVGVSEGRNHDFENSPESDSALEATCSKQV